MNENKPNLEKLIEITNLEVDCKIGKDRHFIAADRKNKLRIYLGVFAVIGSAIIASGIGSSALKLLAVLFKDTPYWTELSATLSHIFPLLVGISTSIIGFLGLEKQTAQHRYVGNAYIDIARKTRSILNSINDINFDTKIKEYESLISKYIDTNKEGESCPTNRKDSKKAMAMNERNRNMIKNEMHKFDLIRLNIVLKEKKEKVSLRACLKKSIYSFFARILATVGIINSLQYKKYLKQLK